MLFRLHRDPAGGAVTRGRRVARAARLAASHQYLYRRNRRRRGTVGAAFEYRPASAYQHRATGTWSTKATSASRGRRHVPGPRCSAGVSRAAPTGGALGATSRTFPFAAERWRYQAGAVVERGRRPELSGRGVGRKIGAALGGAGRWVGVVVAANVAGFAAAVGFALLTPRPVFFLSGAGLAVALVAGGVGWVSVRRSRRRRRRMYLSVAVVASLGVWAWSTVSPLPDPQRPPAMVRWMPGWIGSTRAAGPRCTVRAVPPGPRRTGWGSTHTSIPSRRRRHRNRTYGRRCTVRQRPPW